MTKRECYLYCFECECNGEIPLEIKEASGYRGFKVSGVDTMFRKFGHFLHTRSFLF